MFYFDEVEYRVACARKRIRTVKQAAELVGISPSYLGVIVRGAIPSDETQRAIAKVLGVKVGDLWKPLPTVLVG